MYKSRNLKGGFALPTVLIASVVLLMVLTVSVSSVVAVRTALQTQYYEQLAKTAGEAGVAYAKACLAKNGNVPLWSDVKPLKPNTDCAGNDLVGNNSFSSLVVAGGGSGGGSTGGGGGGGGVVETTFFSMSPGTYTVVVGNGAAAAGNKAIGKDGANSSFHGVVAIGGGGGAYSANSTTSAAGRSGGSGGGGQIYSGTQSPGAGTSGQGNSGGPLSGAGTGSTTGGGGAGGVGLNTTTSNNGGDGGPGVLSTISGASEYYGGGGGGGANSVASKGGAGGGGGGGEIGSPGAPNTGGGGGGGWSYASGNSGAGGSGVVIISYPNNGSIDASGGDSTYVSGAYKIHKFTTVGSSTFQVNSVNPSSCPSDPRCSVVVDGNARSSFSIGKPTLDGEGKAVALPNTGYVELLRSSNGEVWRTYRQPSVQAAVVPGLCSGAATSSLGWSNAVVIATQTVLPNASAAKNISLADGSLKSGQIYFRKDFQVSTSASYKVSANTPTSSDKVELFIDGTPVTTTQGSLKSGTVSLSAGCHTITARLTNQVALESASSFIAAVQQNVTGSAPVVVTDASWRVSAGSPVDFSNTDFYADPDIWTRVYDYGAAQITNSSWQAASGDIFTRLITSNHSGCSTSACPASSYTYYRDGRDIVLSAPTDVRISAMCDDNCQVYVDGQQIISSATWSTINQQTMTLPAGVHHVAATVINAGSTANGSKFSVAVVDVSSGVVLTRTDSYWLASDKWYAGTSPTAVPSSYEASFLPSPSEIAMPTTMDVLVVAGGGGGGGNCTSCGGAGGGGGGGLAYAPGITVTAGNYPIQVGAGGAAGIANNTSGGGNGLASRFGAYLVSGGGGGMGQNGTAGRSGGSGGGGSGGGSPAPGAGGAALTAGFGFAGGAGTGSPYGGGGGGGAGGAGVSAAGSLSGSGGAGFISYLDGTRRVLAAGGGGGTYGSSYYAGAGESGSAGNGATSGAGGAATANTGGGGGGANGNPTGSAGGPGGSGVVFLRFKTGAVTVGGLSGLTYTSSNVTIAGVGYTVYRFTAGSGTLTLTPVN